MGNKEFTNNESYPRNISKNKKNAVSASIQLRKKANIAIKYENII